MPQKSQKAAIGFARKQAKAFFLTIFMLIASSAIIAQPKEKAQLDASTIYKRSKGAVVLIEATLNKGQSSQGSGVAFRYGYNDKSQPNSTWIATNAHVIGNAKEVTVQQEGRSTNAKVEYVDPDLDLALISTRKIGFTTTSIGAAPLEIGEKVYAIGSPYGLENTITEGIISGLRQINGTSVIQTSAAISSGNSGGGLFNAQGNLIGITTFKLRGGENLNFAVSASYINTLSDALLYAELLRITERYMTTHIEWSKIDWFTFVKWFSQNKNEKGSYVSQWKLAERNYIKTRDFDELTALTDTILRHFFNSAQEPNTKTSSSTGQRTSGY